MHHQDMSRHGIDLVTKKDSGPWFNIKMSSYQYRKSLCGDKMILRPSYLHNGISYTGKMTSLNGIRAPVEMGMRFIKISGLAEWQAQGHLSLQEHGTSSPHFVNPSTWQLPLFAETSSTSSRTTWNTSAVELPSGHDWKPIYPIISAFATAYH